MYPLLLVLFAVPLNELQLNDRSSAMKNFGTSLKHRLHKFAVFRWHDAFILKVQITGDHNFVDPSEKFFLGFENMNHSFGSEELPSSYSSIIGMQSRWLRKVIRG